LDALLEGDGVVFVLAGCGLTDECRLTGDVTELREGGDEDRLGSGRNGIVVQEGGSGAATRGLAAWRSSLTLPS
jgi:hypothetical protein